MAEPLADLLRAFAEAHEGTVDTELIELAERFDAGTITIPADGSDEITAMVWPDGVEALTDDELVTLVEGLTALADIDEAGIALINGAADMVAEANTEVEVRTALADAEEAELAAARARLAGGGDEETDEPTDDAEDATAEADSVEGDEPAADADDPADTETAEAPAGDPEPVLAGAARRSRLAALATRSGSPRNRPPAAAASGPRISFAAGADHRQRRGSQGGPTLEDIDQAMTQRLTEFAGSGSIVGRENVRVASIHAEFPEGRRLVDERGRFIGSDAATELVAAVLAAGQRSAGTQVAAGGFCAPAQPIYTVNILGQAARPIRDSALVNFQATRGRVVQLTPPRLQALAGSVGVWTEALDIDAATDPDVNKNILRVVCGPEQESQVEAITSSLLYGNLLARSYGEWVNAWSSLARVHHAEVAEQELFDAIVALATPVTTPDTELSATRDFVNYVARLAWHVRKRNRELRNFPFRLVTSTDVLDIVAEDIAVSAHGESNAENFTQAEQILTGALAARNINVTWSPDITTTGPQGDNTEAANYPTAVPYALYPEGWALHLDEGQEDLGVVRDARLIRQNDVMTFMETFEGVHRSGAKSDARTGSITLCPSGAVYGYADPDGKCAAYT